jgi:enoyl-CoA hydratase/carnithine racemase
LFTGKEIGALEAERIGLVTEVVPDDALDGRVAEVVAEVRQTSPLSRRLFKQCLNELEPVPTDPGVLLAALNSPDTRAALQAFSERRA